MKNKNFRPIRLVMLLLVLIHLLTLTCFASEANAFADVQTWTEGSLAPVVREDTANSMTITSSNAPGDWWKIKLELPRSVEQGKTYTTTFAFTSNVTGPIKYVVDGANYLSTNEYNVKTGENTFTIRFTAGADTYNCLEMGGLGEFKLTFTKISVTEEGKQEEPGAHTHSYVNGKCSCGKDNGFAGVQTWTEGSLTPVVREDTENTMKITSANAAGDWWKVKLELPRSVEEGKIYEAKFVFTSKVTGTIKYNVDGASYEGSNEYNVQAGKNTFTVRFTAGADTYNCLELGGLGEFQMTFTDISLAEVTGGSTENPGTGEADQMILWTVLLSVAGMAVCVLLSKKRNIA